MGNGVIALPFLTSSLYGNEWSASRTGRLTSRERARGTHWIGGRVVARNGLDTVEKVRNILEFILLISWGPE
jgi:hypothetical protein